MIMGDGGRRSQEDVVVQYGDCGRAIQGWQKVPASGLDIPHNHDSNCPLNIWALTLTLQLGRESSLLPGEAESQSLGRTKVFGSAMRRQCLTGIRGAIIKGLS